MNSEGMQATLEMMDMINTIFGTSPSSGLMS